MDERLQELFAKAVPATENASVAGRGLALVAVGGYGRAELSPASDIDVVLVHDADLPEDLVGAVAEQIWYPLWDEGVALDHAVRSVPAMRQAAADDLRAAAGMLDARAVAGDTSIALGLRSEVLADWRRTAKRRIPELKKSCDERIERAGWLAHAATPDLKESGGGLRDGVVLRGLVSTWLVEVPRVEVEALRNELLDVRDALHEVNGRRSDRFSSEVIPEVARVLERDPEELDLHVRALGRRTAHLASTAWRRVEEAIVPGRPRRRSTGGPRLDRLARGVGSLDGEVVLSADADPANDPDLILRAAVAATTKGLMLAESSAARVARDGRPPAAPWPAATRELFVELLAAGPALVGVWEELDLGGVVDQWLPEWEGIRLRGSSSPVHRFTVDRHSIETVVNAAGLVRTVRRPDLLLVAALLHDIGKGVRGDHSIVGAPIAEDVVRRWGFDDDDSARIAQLVRRHLLLPTIATRRDIEDPATAKAVAEIVGDRETLDLLSALTESDARATGPTAWTAWRAGLVRGLVEKTRSCLDPDAPSTADPYPCAEAGGEPTEDAGLAPGEVRISDIPHHTGSLVSIVLADRPALMADLAGALALAGHQIRSARLSTAGGVARTSWELSGDDPDIGRLRLRLKGVLAGEVDLAGRLAYLPKASAPPYVTALGASSQRAGVLEIRAEDARGLVWCCARSISDAGFVIRSAHITTIGPQARNVFYVVRGDGSRPGEFETHRLAAVVADALTPSG